MFEEIGGEIKRWRKREREREIDSEENLIDSILIRGKKQDEMMEQIVAKHDMTLHRCHGASTKLAMQSVVFSSHSSSTCADYYDYHNNNAAAFIIIITMAIMQICSPFKAHEGSLCSCCFADRL